MAVVGGGSGATYGSEAAPWAGSATPVASSPIAATRPSMNAQGNVVYPDTGRVVGPGYSPAGPTPLNGAAPPQNTNMTPLMQQYVDQFTQSQAAQQQAINAGLMQSMQQLGQRRDAAAAAAAAAQPAFAATLQQQRSVNNLTNAQTPMTARFGAQIPAVNGQQLADVQKAGLGALGTANAAAYAAEKAGLAADYSKGAQTLTNQQMQNNAALAQEKNTFGQDLLKMQIANQQHQADLTQQENFTNEQRRATEKFDEHMANAQYGNQPSTNPALAAMGVTTGQANSARQSSEYQGYANTLSNASSKDLPGTAAMINAYLMTKNPGLLTVLKADHPDWFPKNMAIPKAGGGPGSGGIGGFLQNNPTIGNKPGGYTSIVNDINSWF